MPNMEVLQGVARDRYKQDLCGAFQRGAALQGVDLKGNTELNGMVTAAFGPGTGANIQSTEWYPQLMHNQTLFALASWPAP